MISRKSARCLNWLGKDGVVVVLLGRKASVEVLCSVRLCAVLDMRVLASLVRKQTVREQTACLHSGNAAALVVRIDKGFTTAIADSLDI
jgi:hypothetical protein